MSLFRLSFQTDPSFKQFYNFRPRIETLNSSLTRWHHLKDIISRTLTLTIDST
ncbi:hypothetical protein [Athalassotoga saccharophila]|uniref:hypothetical protein n=1 Tax=Athalassotoga saccharophila TaxID=1441386 RepID=UPI001E64DC52|nr:hypothetical protein [Athalassotoga saccharophila]